MADKQVLPEKKIVSEELARYHAFARDVRDLDEGVHQLNSDFRRSFDELTAFRMKKMRWIIGYLKRSTMLLRSLFIIANWLLRQAYLCSMTWGTNR